MRMCCGQHDIDYFIQRVSLDEGKKKHLLVLKKLLRVEKIRERLRQPRKSIVLETDGANAE